MTPADRDQLAAEYALGVLDGDALARAEALFAEDPAFARAAAEWTARLAELDRHVPAVEPDTALWRRIEDTIEASERAPKAAVSPAARPTVPTAEPSSLGRWWSSLGFWRPAGLAAGFAALLLTVGLGVAVQRANRAPVLVAVLLTDASRPAAVVNAFADGRTELIPLGDIPVPPGRALEIWTLWDRARGPVSVGLIDAARRVTLRTDGLPRPGPDQLFEITLERPRVRPRAGPRVRS